MYIIFCHLNLLDPWHLSPIYLHLGWVSRHYSLYGPSVYRFNIDPDIAAVGRRGEGFFIHCFWINLTLLIQMWKSISSALFWTSGEGRARRSPVVHYLDYASLAWGFLIFFCIPMRVVKATETRIPMRVVKRDCVTYLFHYPAFIHICLLGYVHHWRVLRKYPPYPHACRKRQPCGGLLFWLPFGASALGAIFFVCELFITGAHFVWKLYGERADCSSRLPLDLRCKHKDTI